MKKIVVVLGIVSVLSLGLVFSTNNVEKTADLGTVQINKVVDPGGNGGG